jgi:hypothetical protein
LVPIASAQKLSMLLFDHITHFYPDLCNGLLIPPSL